MPVFYLKNFALNSSNKLIALFNLRSNTFVLQAGLKDQAYKNYFYGADKFLEDNLGFVEDVAATVIRNIIHTDNDPKYLSQDHFTLLAFTILLNARTLYASEALDEMIDKLAKQIFSKDPKYKDHIKNVKFSLNNPAHGSIQGATQSFPIVLDLEYKLIINNTKLPFITSDNPVVLYNQFFENRKTWGSNTGYATKGLQIYIPLSPRHLILFYDPKLYRIGSKRHKPITTVKATDIDALNSLQVLNAHSNLYFNESITEKYIRDLTENAAHNIRKSKNDINEYEGGNDEQGNIHSLIHFFKNDIRCGLTLSFARESPKSNDFVLGHKTVHLRDELLVKVHSEFYKLVEQGKYKPSQFFDYLDQFRKSPSSNSQDNVA